MNFTEFYLYSALFIICIVKVIFTHGSRSRTTASQKNMSEIIVEQQQNATVEALQPENTAGEAKATGAEEVSGSPKVPATENMTLPLELMDQCIGKQVWVIIDSPREFVATLVAIDDFVNLVLEDVTEYDMTDPENLGIKTYKRPKMLLNAKYIAMIIPNGKGPVVPESA